MLMGMSGPGDVTVGRIVDDVNKGRDCCPFFIPGAAIESMPLEEGCCVG